MLRILFGVFIVLHGLVHLLYFWHSRRLFELSPGLSWPEGSWAFSKFLGNTTTRMLASIACILATVVFVVGGAASLAKLAWWRPLVVVASAFSSLVYVLFWNGRMERLPDQGGIGIMINLIILVLSLVLW